jgi:iron complex outermembrane receptor protein
MNRVPGAAARAAHVLIFFLVIGVASAEAQSGWLVAGTVRDASGQPVVGATVRLDDNSLGALTDARGVYRLANVPAGRRVLVVDHIGFRSTRRVLDLAGDVALDFVLQDAALRVDAVVVTATGVAQRIMESQASTGVITGPEMRESMPSHPAEIAGRVPGAWVTVAGSGEGHMTAIRQPLNTNPVYLFLEDGIPTRSTGFFNHNALYEINVPQAGRMEILKGPGTALYGSDAIGGVINVETRAPSVTPGVELFAEGGGHGWSRALLSASGSRGATGIRADLNLTEWTGWRDATGYDRQSATLRWDQRLSEQMRVKTVASWSRIDQIDPSSLTRNVFEDSPQYNRFPIATRQIEAVRLSSAFELQGKSAALTITPFARWNEMSLLPSWMLAFDPVYYTTGHKSAGVLARARTDVPALRTRLTAGVDIDHSPGDHLETIIVPQRSGDLFTGYTNGAAAYDYDVTFQGVSPYVQAEFTPVSKLHFSAGLRYDHIGYEYDNKLDVATTGRHRKPADATVQYDHLSPKLGFAWELGSYLGLFGSYRHSFRAPSEAQLFRQGSAVSSVDLEPIRADALELGLRGAAGAFDYEVTGYDMRVEDDVLAFVRADGLRENQNAGETRHRGLEVGAGVNVNPWLRLDAAYSHSKQTYEFWQPRPTLSYAGKEIERAPRNLFNVRARLQPQLLRGGQAALEWAHVGAYWEDPENAHQYKGHDLLNVRASYGLPWGMQLIGRINNVTNQRYAEIASFTAAELEQLSPGAPRMVYLGVQANWPRK